MCLQNRNINIKRDNTCFSLIIIIIIITNIKWVLTKSYLAKICSLVMELICDSCNTICTNHHHHHHNLFFVLFINVAT